MHESIEDREPGTIGRYAVSDFLGAGSRTRVYLAEGPHSRRRVAVKVAREPLDGGPDLLDRFLREQEAASRVPHPGIVHVLEVGEDPAAGPFQVLELVEGASLAEWTRRSDPAVETRLELLIQVATALEAAHAREVVHGDLKPGEILVTADGSAKVGGFVVRDDSPAMPAVGAGWAYVAPERVAGGEATATTDAYSLAVIAFELLTGRLPEGPDAATDLIPEARIAFERALARDPHERRSDPRSLLRSLVEASSLEGTIRERLLRELPLSDAERREATARLRRPARLAALGVAASLLTVVAFERWMGEVPEPPPIREIQIDSTPPGATILLDGEVIGVTPRRAFVRSDARRLRLERDGYEAKDLVLDGIGSEVAATLAPRPVQIARNRERPSVPAPASPAGLRAGEPPEEPEAAGLIPLLADWLRGR